MNNRSEIRVGLTVIAGIALLIWVILWAKNVSIFNDDKELKVSFDSVAGLETGDMVTVSGMKMGSVASINNIKNEVIVTMNLNKEVVLTNNSKFFIQMADLMGTKKIEIDPGDSAELLNYSEIYSGKFSGDISTAMEMLSSVQNDLVSLIKEFRVTMSEVNSLLKDDKIKNQITSSLKNANNLITKLNETITKNDKNFSELINNSNELVKNGNSFIKENDENISALLKNTNNTLNQLKTFLHNSDSLIVQTVSGKNNLGKLLNDKSLIDDIKISINKLNELLQLFNSQLKGDGLKVDADIF